MAEQAQERLRLGTAAWEEAVEGAILRTTQRVEAAPFTARVNVLLPEDLRNQVRMVARKFEMRSDGAAVRYLVRRGLESLVEGEREP